MNGINLIAKTEGSVLLNVISIQFNSIQFNSIQSNSIQLNFISFDPIQMNVYKQN